VRWDGQDIRAVNHSRIATGMQTHASMGVSVAVSRKMTTAARSATLGGLEIVATPSSHSAAGTKIHARTTVFVTAMVAQITRVPAVLKAGQAILALRKKSSAPGIAILVHMGRAQAAAGQNLTASASVDGVAQRVILRYRTASGMTTRVPMAGRVQAQAEPCTPVAHASRVTLARIATNRCHTVTGTQIRASILGPVQALGEMTSHVSAVRQDGMEKLAVCARQDGQEATVTNLCHFVTGIQPSALTAVRVQARTAPHLPVHVQLDGLAKLARRDASKWIVAWGYVTRILVCANAKLGWGATIVSDLPGGCTPYGRSTYAAAACYVPRQLAQARVATNTLKGLGRSGVTSAWHARLVS